MAAVTISQPKRHNLTESALLDLDFQPLYIGDAIRWRFKLFTAAGAAQSLSSAVLVLDIKTAGGTILRRRSDTPIAGAGVNEIEIDADQTNEGVDGDGNPTGKGVFRINFRSTSAEVTSLTTVFGRAHDYEVVVQLGGTTDDNVILRGKIDVIPRYGTSPAP